MLGGAGRGRFGEPYVGPAVRQVLEFAEVPVLVVPPRREVTAGVGPAGPAGQDPAATGGDRSVPEAEAASPDWGALPSES